ncbi:MAG: hypothetical protein WBF04_08340 [Candidatus Sulfotelmatobacter sp.]
MPRSNKEAQGNRSRRGKLLELSLFERFESLLDRTSLDVSICLKRQVPLCINGVVKKIDFGFCTRTEPPRWLAFVGCKASFKERDTEDMWQAMHAHRQHGLGVPWLEYFESESPEDSPHQIRTRATKALALSCGEFAAVISCTDREGMLAGDTLLLSALTRR